MQTAYEATLAFIEQELEMKVAFTSNIKASFVWTCLVLHVVFSLTSFVPTRHGPMYQHFRVRAGLLALNCLPQREIPERNLQSVGLNFNYMC